MNQDSGRDGFGLGPFAIGNRRGATGRENRSVDISVRKHGSPASQRVRAVNVSTGGMRVEPAVAGYVGEHVFIDAGSALENVEARIAYHDGPATGLAFIQPLSESVLARLFA
jgi:hypothetical protein